MMGGWYERRPGIQSGGVGVKVGTRRLQRGRPEMSGGWRRDQRRAHIGGNVSVRRGLVRVIRMRETLIDWQNRSPSFSFDTRGF